MTRKQFYQKVTEDAKNQIKTGAVGQPDYAATINIALVSHVLKVALDVLKGLTVEDLITLIES